MINSLDEYLNIQDEMFEDFDEYFPQMQKILKANEIGTKILDFIDKELDNFNEEVFHSIDFEEIMKKIDVNKNEKIQGDILTEIYTEIEETFRAGGRISLSEYILQGNVIYTDMINKLFGKVDYSIDYSEEELKKAEKQAFERFSMVLSMYNTNQYLIQNFKLTPEGKSLQNRIESYLNVLPDEIVAKSIDERIAEVNGLVLAVENLKSLDCEINNFENLNSFFSEKIKNLTIEINHYAEDKKVNNAFNTLKNNVENFKNISKDKYKDLYSSISDKLDIIAEKILENDKLKDRSNDLEFS